MFGLGNFYSKVNPTNLSGAIDVVVVSGEELSCSPIYCRFGKNKILKINNQRVTMTVNGSVTDMVVKLGATGDVYFLIEDIDIPDNFSTEKENFCDSRRMLVFNLDVCKEISGFEKKKFDFIRKTRFFDYFRDYKRDFMVRKMDYKVFDRLFDKNTRRASLDVKNDVLISESDKSEYFNHKINYSDDEKPKDVDDFYDPLYNHESSGISNDKVSYTYYDTIRSLSEHSIKEDSSNLLIDKMNYKNNETKRSSHDNSLTNDSSSILCDNISFNKQNINFHGLRKSSDLKINDLTDFQLRSNKSFKNFDSIRNDIIELSNNYNIDSQNFVPCQNTSKESSCFKNKTSVCFMNNNINSNYPLFWSKKNAFSKSFPFLGNKGSSNEQKRERSSSCTDIQIGSQLTRDLSHFTNHFQPVFNQNAMVYDSSKEINQLIPNKNSLDDYILQNKTYRSFNRVRSIFVRIFQKTKNLFSKTIIKRSQVYSPQRNPMHFNYENSSLLYDSNSHKNEIRPDHTRIQSLGFIKSNRFYLENLENFVYLNFSADDSIFLKSIRKEKLIVYKSLDTNDLQSLNRNNTILYLNHCKSSSFHYINHKNPSGFSKKFSFRGSLCNCNNYDRGCLLDKTSNKLDCNSSKTTKYKKNLSTTKIHDKKASDFFMDYCSCAYEKSSIDKKNSQNISKSTMKNLENIEDEKVDFSDTCDPFDLLSEVHSESHEETHIIFKNLSPKTQTTTLSRSNSLDFNIKNTIYNRRSKSFDSFGIVSCSCEFSQGSKFSENLIFKKDFPTFCNLNACFLNKNNAYIETSNFTPKNSTGMKISNPNKIFLKECKICDSYRKSTVFLEYLNTEKNLYVSKQEAKKTQTGILQNEDLFQAPNLQTKCTDHNKENSLLNLCPSHLTNVIEFSPCKNNLTKELTISQKATENEVPSNTKYKLHDSNKINFDKNVQNSFEKPNQLKSSDEIYYKNPNNSDPKSNKEEIRQEIKKLNLNGETNNKIIKSGSKEEDSKIILAEIEDDEDLMLDELHSSSDCASFSEKKELQTKSTPISNLQAFEKLVKKIQENRDIKNTLNTYREHRRYMKHIKKTTYQILAIKNSTFYKVLHSIKHFEFILNNYQSFMMIMSGIIFPRTTNFSENSTKNGLSKNNNDIKRIPQSSQNEKTEGNFYIKNKNPYFLTYKGKFIKKMNNQIHFKRNDKNKQENDKILHKLLEANKIEGKKQCTALTGCKNVKIEYSDCLYKKITSTSMQNIFSQNVIEDLDDISTLVVSLKSCVSCDQQFFLPYSLFNEIFFFLRNLQFTTSRCKKNQFYDYLELKFNKMCGNAIKTRKIQKQNLVLTDNQLRRLNLQDINDVEFTIKGTNQTISLKMYKYSKEDKIIISDIDGTITKSDTWGHVYGMIGKDYTHEGIAELFSKIEKNGYKFLYLSSRPIGQTNTTKAYLDNIFQNKCGLPKGPVLLSPDTVFNAIYREIIKRNPEKFKIACLKNISDLFKNNPFVGGFGNRKTDVIAYKALGIPESKIFTINSTGKIMIESNRNMNIDYFALNNYVEIYFPDKDKKIETYEKTKRWW